MSPKVATKRSRARASTSALALHRALVPAAQREVGDERQDDEDQDAGAGDHEECGEHARDIELVAGLQYAVGEPGLDAARAGDELGHYRADEGEAAADPQAAEEVGKRARQ